MAGGRDNAPLFESIDAGGSADEAPPPSCSHLNHNKNHALLADQIKLAQATAVAFRDHTEPGFFQVNPREGLVVPANCVAGVLHGSPVVLSRSSASDNDWNGTSRPALN